MRGYATMNGAPIPSPFPFRYCASCKGGHYD